MTSEEIEGEDQRDKIAGLGLEATFFSLAAHYLHLIAQRAPKTFATFAPAASDLTMQAGANADELGKVFAAISDAYGFDQDAFSQDFLSAAEAEDTGNYRKHAQNLN